MMSLPLPSAPEHYLTLAIAILLCGIAIGRLLRRPAREREAEQHFHAIFDHAMLGMARSGLDKCWIEVNPALCKMLGYSAAELTGKSWTEVTHPDDLPENAAKFAAVLRGEADGYEMEKRFIRPDGSVVHTAIAARGIRKANGAIDSFSVVIEDITQRRETERQLARQVERSRVLLELPLKAEQLAEREFVQFALEQAETLTGSSIGFLHFVNPDGESIELVAWSRNTLEKYCSAAFDCHYPITQAGIWADAVRTKAPVTINDYATAANKRGLPDGHSTLTRLLSVPVMEDGAVRMMTGVGNKATNYTPFDVETLQLIGNETWRIVRRQRADVALRQATQVVNASPVVCFRWAACDGWPVVFVSDNVQQWGYSADDLKAGRPAFAELVHPDDLARVAAEVARHTAAGQASYEQEYRLITADNQVIWVVDRTQVLRDDDGQVVFYDGVLTDITERKQQQLKISENLFQQQKLNKRLEEANNQLLQSEKMASIGQLAAGIAHELNNPIGFVHSNLGTLDGYLRDLMDIIDTYERIINAPDSTCQQSPALEHIKEERDFAFLRTDIFNLVAESKDGLGRVRKIVQDLKSFSRVGEQEWQEADLHQGLDSTLNIVWNELKYKCKVVKEYGVIPHIHCLISQLNQVFMNLLVNAGHAIESEGTITIRTGCTGEDRVWVEVSDTGKGIAPENISRIFEPFFTTKPVGKGTGLGLSLSYSIVERHHGRIEVDSEPGRGSTFRVVLPIHPPFAPSDKTATETLAG
ncbi:PAS domain S-box protein [Dechloromonas denitrificans]|uniref:PAS domain S-box protein n=2 Tax=Dechloromonas denitrificans TaxID=281362 RepID=UPI001CFA7AB1|nr:PAS domain S-box protein [Dechloromonas denitrificans]UCV09283.1 PAS domain S-box protein [Dechloromonas denitrificans]